MEIVTPADAEAHVAALAAELTTPTADECVLCYTERMLTAFGCDRTLRWALRWRDLRRPSAPRLERRLNARGGFCDCEVLLDGWTLRAGSASRSRDGELRWPTARPGCAGVKPARRGPAATGGPGGGPGGDRDGGWAHE